MDIKPIITNDTYDNVVSNNMHEINANTIKSLDKKEAVLSTNHTLDPKGIIPNEVYRIFSSEKKLKKLNLIVFSILFISSLIVCLLFAFYPSLFANLYKKNNPNTNSTPWGWYIVPVIVISISVVYFTFSLIDFISIKKTIVFYRGQIERGDYSAPSFIKTLYIKLMKKQVRRTWLVISILFYLGLFTLAFWGLKDKKWGILDFQKWISDSFSNPNILVYTLCGIMLLVLLLFIIKTLYRKKMINDIQVFFGNEIMSYQDFSKENSNAHKFWAKIFFLSVLIILVIPIIVVLIVLRLRKRN